MHFIMFVDVINNILIQQFIPKAAHKLIAFFTFTKKGNFEKIYFVLLSVL